MLIGDTCITLVSESALRDVRALGNVVAGVPQSDWNDLNGRLLMPMLKIVCVLGAAIHTSVNTREQARLLKLP